MEKGAKILVRDCAGVKNGEDVLIVTDEERLPIAQAVKKAAEEAGGGTSLVICPPRTIDNEEPAPPIGAAMSRAGVIIMPVTLALSHTKAVREAIDEGARVLSMTAFTEGMMRSGGLMADFRARKPLCDSLAERLTAARRVRVTNPAGTEVEFGLEGRGGNSHCCIVDSPGFSAVPNIEANTSPADGSAAGVLVCDGIIDIIGSEKTSHLLSNVVHFIGYSARCQVKAQPPRVDRPDAIGDYPIHLFPADAPESGLPTLSHHRIRKPAQLPEFGAA